MVFNFINHEEHEEHQENPSKSDHLNRAKVFFQLFFVMPFFVLFVSFVVDQKAHQ